MRRRIGSTTERAGHGDEGSTLLLTIGFAVLALVAVLICADATSLYIGQKRLDALADAAALAGADGFTLGLVDGEARVTLSEQDVSEHVDLFLDEADAEVVLVAAEVPDGRSARVTITRMWHPPVATMFVPSGFELRSTATARNWLG